MNLGDEAYSWHDMYMEIHEEVEVSVDIMVPMMWRRGRNIETC
jgi:hypothetical protein